VPALLSWEGRGAGYSLSHVGSRSCVLVFMVLEVPTEVATSVATEPVNSALPAIWDVSKSGCLSNHESDKPCAARNHVTWLGTGY
jgi:hypothetical protein